MPTHPMLPRQFDSENLGTSKPGEMKREEREFLGRLKVPPKGGNPARTRVLPDPWSHAITFQWALEGRIREMHPEAIRQWRGLIALFALEAQRGFRLERKPIELPTGEHHSRSALQNTLSSLAPIGTLADRKARWPGVEVLTMNDVTLGLIVPTTLVCPTRALLGDVAVCPWIKDGRVGDPLTQGMLSADDLTVLNWFCESARENLQEIGRRKERDQDLFNAMDRAFEAMIKEAQAALSGRPVHKNSVLREVSRPRIEVGDRDPLVVLAARAWMRFKVTEVPYSDCILELRSGELLGSRQVILLDPPESAFKAPPQEVKVWNEYSLQQMTDKSLRDKVKEQATVHGYACVETDDFFTTKLVKVRDFNTRLPKHYIGSTRNYLLPLSPLALLVAGPAELIDGETCRIVDNDPGEPPRCELRVSLRNSRTPAVLVKEFTEQETVDAPPNLAIWPNFRSPAWKHYYILDSLATDLKRFLLGRPLTAATVAKFVLGVDHTQAAQLGERTRGGDFCTREDVRSREQYYPIFESDFLPEAFPAVYTSRREFSDAVTEPMLGLFVVPPASFKEVQPSPQQWKFGVDFGSTKTTVYASRGAQGASVVALGFKDRVIRLLFDESNEQAPHLDFLPTGMPGRPAAEVKTPILTAFRERENEAALKMRPIVSGHIYFVEELEWSLAQVTGSNPPHFDLKWGAHGADEKEQQRNSDRVKRFLEQLALQCSAEAVAEGIQADNIHWCFGYPEAFSGRKREHFKMTVTEAVQVAVGSKEENIGLCSESRSSGMYFLRARDPGFQAAPEAGHFVTIDIGGSTSDICVWQEQDIIWRNSVRLAGSHMLIEPMIAGPGRLELLRAIARNFGNDVQQLHKWMKVLDDVERNTNDSEALRPLVEMIIGSSEFADYFTKSLNRPEVAKATALIEACVSVVLGSLLQYIGTVIKVLREELETFKPREKEKLRVYIGGRASLVCQKFVEGPNTRLRKGLINLLKDATPGTFDDVSLFYSPRPKHEVAYGCVLDDGKTRARKGDGRGDENDDSGDFNFLILGEEAQPKEGDGALAADRRIDTLQNGKDWQLNVDLPRLRELLTHISKRCWIDIRHENIADIAANVDRKIEEAIEQTGGIVDKNVIEPPFIAAVRRLLQDMVQGVICTMSIRD